jgi:hypothetical protein
MTSIVYEHFIIIICIWHVLHFLKMRDNIEQLTLSID